MTMISNSFIDVYIIIPILAAILCVLMSRLMGRKEEQCPTWKDKLQMAVIYILCWFCCQFFIYMTMMAQYVYITGINPLK